MKLAFLAFLILVLASCTPETVGEKVLPADGGVIVVEKQCLDGSKTRAVLAVDGRGPSGVLIRGNGKILQSGDIVVGTLCEQRMRLGIVKFSEGQPVVFRPFREITPDK